MTIKHLIPREARHALRRTWFAAWDVVDWARGTRGTLTPPRRLSFVYGGGDFRKQGELLIDGAIGAGLTPAMRVLDVGCGIGRFAVPLTGFLDASQGGSYDGFDIIRPGIRWCTNTITARHPHFRFSHVDLFHRQYNPTGTLDSGSFRFPYANEAFDFVFLASVFTHMLPEVIESYLGEIARTTARGARVYITWFLRTPESRAAVAAGRARPDVRHDRGFFGVMDPEVPETAVAYDEGWAIARYAEHGFHIVPPIRHGTWSRRPDGHHFQDVVVAERV